MTMMMNRQPSKNECLAFLHHCYLSFIFRPKLNDSLVTTTTNATVGRNRLNHSDEFYQIRAQLQEQYNLKSNLNHFLEQHFNDDLDDYQSTKTLLQNHKERHAMQHHEIDTSTLRLDRHEPSSSHHPRSTSSKRQQDSLRKGFLRSSTSALNLRPVVHTENFDHSTSMTDQDSSPKVQRTNKHRLLLGNEHDIVQVLNEQFPGIYVSSEMQAKLNDQFSKHIDNVFKSRIELLNAQQGNMNDVRSTGFPPICNLDFVFSWKMQNINMIK